MPEKNKPINETITTTKYTKILSAVSGLVIFSTNIKCVKQCKIKTTIWCLKYHQKKPYQHHTN